MTTQNVLWFCLADSFVVGATNVLCPFDNVAHVIWNRGFGWHETCKVNVVGDHDARIQRCKIKRHDTIVNAWNGFKHVCALIMFVFFGCVAVALYNDTFG